jgi:hemerythrin
VLLMSFVAWSDEFGVGIEELDIQHRKWFDILNRLHDAMKEGKSKDVMDELFTELIDYTKYHFESEEEYLKNNNYPDIPSHLEVHTALKNQVIDFSEQYKNGSIGLSVQLFNLLKDWLQNHIMNIDKKYAVFFGKK